jgi:hypothetical protein
MGRRKKTDEEKAAKAKTIDAKFVGGPKDSTTLQIVNPPPEHIRLVAGINDWGTYEWDVALRLYRHIGDVPIERKGIV